MTAGHVFHRSTEARPPVAVRGQGIFLIDAQGRRYIDACGGAAVSCLGHGHAEIVAALADQAAQLEYVHTGFFTTDAAEQLAALIAEMSPGRLDRVWYTGSGSEAVEAALKLARQYHLERGDPGRSRVIARHLSYHGNTLGALAAGGSAWRRAPYEPLLIDVALVDPCFEYRFAEPGETSDAYGRRLADAFEQEIVRLGPETVMAFVAETVVGATAGAVPPVPDYLKRVRAICDRHGILLILDEVMCGSGRTGTLHACEQEGIAPDLMAIAKGLGGGFAPIGAVLVGGRIIEAFAKGSGLFQHGHTYLGHPLACAGALAVQQVIRRDNLLANVRRQGEHLTRRLGERFGNHHHVGDVRGRGLFQAIELVADRGSKTTFDPKHKLHARIKQHAMAPGLMVYPQ